MKTNESAARQHPRPPVRRPATRLAPRRSFFTKETQLTTTNPPPEQRQRACIDLTKVRAGGLHGLKIGNEIGQMIFAGPAEAISFAQRLKPVRGGDKIEIVPVAIVEKREDSALTHRTRTRDAG
jgi:hypothetical protein